MYNPQYLADLEKYIREGGLAGDFEEACEDTRLEILDFLEQLMTLGELADETATRLIFKGDMLARLAGASVDE